MLDEILATIVMIKCNLVPVTYLIISIGPNKNNGAKEFTVVLLMQFVMSLFQKLFLYKIYPFDAMFQQLIIFIAFKYIRKMNLPSSIIYFAFILQIIIITEGLFMYTLDKFDISYLKFNNSRLNAGNEMTFLTFGIYYCLFIAIYKTYRYCKKKITRRISISLRIVVSSLLLFIYTIMFFQNITLLISMPGDSHMYFLDLSYGITLACYCGYLYMNINLYKAIERNRDIEKQMEITQALIDELRRFKHNYLNIIHGFGYHISFNGSPELKSYYDQVTKESNLISNDNITAIQKIKNAAFTNLIFTHINLMSEVSVSFFVNVENEITSLMIRNVDLCQIMGIFLDNAREAAMETANPRVKLDILKRDGIIELYLYNTYKEFEARKIKDSTRGNGLIYCQRILGKYKTVLHNTYIHNAMLVQQLIIPEK